MAVIVVAVGAFFGYRLASNTPEVGGAVVQQSGSDYSGGPVEMTVLPEATAIGGNIAIPV